MNNLDKLFEQIYLENLFNQILEGEEQIDVKDNTKTNNWTEKMSELRNLLKTQTEISYIEFTKENVKKLGEFIQSPIERVFLDNIGGETLFEKMNRKSGGRGDIDRRMFIDAIPKVLETPSFIIEHSPSKNENYKEIRHLYFKTVNLNSIDYKLMFVVSLLCDEEEQKIKPKLISFYKVDLYNEIYDGDIILYEGGQQTKVKLSKGQSNTTN